MNNNDAPALGGLYKMRKSLTDRPPSTVKYNDGYAIITFVGGYVMVIDNVTDEDDMITIMTPYGQHKMSIAGFNVTYERML
jgi:hypothetical protein